MVVHWRKVNFGNSILEAISIFGHFITHIPKGILEKIERVCFKFFWASREKSEGIHLVKRRMRVFI